MSSRSSYFNFMNRVVRNAGTLTFLLCILFYFLPFKPKPFGDGEYHQGTLQLLQFIRHGFSGEVEVTKGLFTLIYYLVPYSFASIFNTEKAYLLFGLVYNWIAVSAAVGVLFKLFREQGFSIRLQWFVFLLLNLFPIHVYYSMGILAETAAFLLSSLFVYFLVTIYHGKKDSYLHYIGLSLSLALFISVRPNFMPYALLFLPLVFFMKKPSTYRSIAAGVFVSAICLLVMSERKLDHTDAEFKKFQLVKGFVWSRYELRDEPFNWLPQHGMDAFASSDYKNNIKKRVELMQLCKEQHLDLQEYAFHWMINDIQQHPGLFLRQTILKYVQSQTFVVTPLMKSKKSSVLKWGVHIYINLLNYILLLSVFYSVWLWWKQKQAYSFFLPLLLFYATAFITIFFLHSEQRYVFPTRPEVLVMFAFGVHAWSQSRKQQSPIQPSTVS